MNISKLIKIEFWKIIHSKNILLCVLGEVICLVFAMFENSNEIRFPLSDIYLTQYMGIALTIRYVYTSVVITTMFSKDIENGIVDTYIAVGSKRLTIAVAKTLCLWIVIFCVVTIASLMYIILSFFFNGFEVIPLIFIASIILSMIPLSVHSLLTIGIDVGLMNGVITTFCTVVLIVATSMLPYDVAKWIYLTYNNPMITYVYQDQLEVMRMINVLIFSMIVFLAINYRLIKKYGR